MKWRGAADHRSAPRSVCYTQTLFLSNKFPSFDSSLRNFLLFQPKQFKWAVTAVFQDFLHSLAQAGPTLDRHDKGWYDVEEDAAFTVWPRG